MVSLRFAAITLLAVAFVVAVQAHPVQDGLPDLSKRQMEGGPGDDGNGTGPGWGSCWNGSWWMPC
ncbi:hypothetical protein H4R33_006050 [Dimargaris cristalligena]|nr:hypothetical protein H4R33_006050 [Dimargaris cristalligena]